MPSIISYTTHLFPYSSSQASQKSRISIVSSQSAKHFRTWLCDLMFYQANPKIINALHRWIFNNRITKWLTPLVIHPLLNNSIIEICIWKSIEISEWRVFFPSLFLIKPGSCKHVFKRAQACLVVYIQAQAAMWRRQWGSACEPESSFKRLSPEVIRLSATHCATDPIKHKHRPKHFTDWHTGMPQPSSQPLFSLGFLKALMPLCMWTSFLFNMHSLMCKKM